MSGEAIHALFSGTYSGPLFVVECYWPGINAARVATADAKTRSALEALGDDTPAAHHLGSILLPRDELLLRIFAGGSRALVNAANVRAGIPVERTLEILALPPAPPVNR